MTRFVALFFVAGRELLAGIPGAAGITLLIALNLLSLSGRSGSKPHEIRRSLCAEV
jgi:hypothetical protein